MLKVKDLGVVILVRTNLPTCSKQKMIASGLHFLPEWMLLNAGRASARIIVLFAVDFCHWCMSHSFNMTSWTAFQHSLRSALCVQQPETMCVHRGTWWSSDPTSGLLKEKKVLLGHHHFCGQWPTEWAKGLIHYGNSFVPMTFLSEGLQNGNNTGRFLRLRSPYWRWRDDLDGQSSSKFLPKNSYNVRWVCTFP